MIEIAIAAVVLLVLLAAVTFWQAQNNPVNNVDIDLMMQGCIVKFAPDGSSEVVKFGDARCQK